jgi:nitrate ABC transporter ATP-binding subunit
MPPVMQYFRAQRENGGQLIVADPRLTPTAKEAALHLRLTPGADAALANGLLHVLIRDGLIDAHYVQERTEGFEQVKAVAATYWPERVERITGVPEASLVRAARMLGHAKTAMVLTARGPEQQAQGVNNTLAYINIALALGMVGKPNSGYGCLTGQGNGQGGREHGQKADQLPGYRRIDDPAARKHVAGVWGVPDVAKMFNTSKGQYTALRDVNLDIQRGEFVSIIGHSGCGKSTLLSMAAGLERPTSGSLTLDGHPILGPGPDRGMVFQHHGLLPWLSVRSNVYEALDAVRPKDPRAQKEEQVDRALAMVGLAPHQHKRPSQISGGMKQRTAIARAFVVGPQLLLLDESFGALDALTRSSMQEELIRLWSYERASETVVMVTHDIDEAIFLSDRIVVMTNGPEAIIGGVVNVSLPRPREKRAMVHTEEYASLKDGLLYLLNGKVAHAA